MAARKKFCCCNAPTECRETTPCKVYAITPCAQADAGSCPTLPVFNLVVGPGSTALVSATLRYAKQDLRIYGVTGEDYDPVDPGAFTGNPFDDDCAWSHPFTDAIPSEVWARGRKICKTLISFAGVEFVWSYNSTTCTWGWFASDVAVEVGKASTIVETGTAEVAGTLHLRQEFDDTETVSVDMFLGLPDAIDWCPGAPTENLLLSFSVRRHDGADFDRMFDEDWVGDDGLVGSAPHDDYLPFPTDCSEYGDPCDEFAFPPEMTSLSEFDIAVTMLPLGRAQYMSASIDALETPTQLNEDVEGSDPYLGFARASGYWVEREGSLSVEPHDRECLPPPTPCAACLTEAAAAWTFNSIPFACAGLTAITISETYVGPEDSTTYWRAHQSNPTAGPWFTGHTSDLLTVTNYWQYRLHCELVSGVKRWRMHLWTRTTNYRVETNFNMPPPVPETEVITDTDTGWVDEGAIGGSVVIPSSLWTVSVTGACNIQWEIDPQWSYDPDEDDCVGAEDSGTCGGVAYSNSVIFEECPGPARSGTRPLGAACTQCVAPPAGAWTKNSHTEGTRCVGVATAWTNAGSNFWPGYDLGSPTAGGTPVVEAATSSYSKKELHIY